MQVIAFDRPDLHADHAKGESGIYTFEYQDKGVVGIVPGISLPNLGAVQDEVNRSSGDLWKDALDKSEAPVGWAVRARSDRGDIVATCTYEELQRRGS
ncbi:DUF6894 family protein [Mesorhizobium loti]|uniref:DUF6894 family protein n=1 Tax=Rhizobium loti TaxID=381 RepID=UPI001C01F52E|nr:hypothetical protein [Mesorhizobium loti]